MKKKNVAFSVYAHNTTVTALRAESLRCAKGFSIQGYAKMSHIMLRVKIMLRIKVYELLLRNKRDNYNSQHPFYVDIVSYNASLKKYTLPRTLKTMRGAFVHELHKNTTMAFPRRIS